MIRLGGISKGQFVLQLYLCHSWQVFDKKAHLSWVIREEDIKIRFPSSRNIFQGFTRLSTGFLNFFFKLSLSCSMSHHCGLWDQIFPLLSHYAPVNFVQLVHTFLEVQCLRLNSTLQRRSYQPWAEQRYWLLCFVGSTYMFHFRVVFAFS